MCVVMALEKPIERQRSDRHTKHRMPTGEMHLVSLVPDGVQERREGYRRGMMCPALLDCTRAVLGSL